MEIKKQMTSSEVDKIYTLQNIKLQYTETLVLRCKQRSLRPKIGIGTGTGSACVSRKREPNICRGVSSCFLYLSFGTVIVQGYTL